MPIEQPDGTFAPGERSKDASEALLNQFGSWKDVPDEMLGQSGYWKKNWNTDAGKETQDNSNKNSNHTDKVWM